ncbi:4-hydroxy-tetrahydrodipicolinate synthase [Litoribacter ruber]|uniref:4-hydroxy-tetrahydrodipicolinate synthase n=1 Tax=Litoribacter ruber TaxID=702568 RepID=A0AAP2CG22_9BACT|nr:MULTISPECIES: 4-hydroxy-tetrahydrodipicolinate synthase [Litoribacter]MBS9523135.1 4-hydroxy-tetrahydrodipicolinate synthase [Litoribacter alkaliphilus]MBT0810702.1 4-hydroxy-tetrahydrodipicolinate synthase [Litoribacter ruber]
MKKLKGTGVAMVTPFNEDYSINYGEAEQLINHLIKGGADYLVIQGTTGETATLTKEEKKEVLRHAIEITAGRVPIVYGIGGNNTQAVLDEIKTTDFKDIAAILSVSPYYNKPSQKGIIAHFTAIADASPVPVILYNVPGRTMSNLTADTTLALAAHENIIGIKEASGNLEQCMSIAAQRPDGFLLISGDDLLTTSMRAIGADGVISVLANAYPEIFKTICHGSMEESKKATFKLLEINPLMYAESNPVGVKNLLMHLGVCGDQVRLPLLRASKELDLKINTAMEKV